MAVCSSLNVGVCEFCEDCLGSVCREDSIQAAICEIPGTPRFPDPQRSGTFGQEGASSPWATATTAPRCMRSNQSCARLNSCDPVFSSLQATLL